jgi:hypothetical protein
MHLLIREYINQRGVHPDYRNRQDARSKLIASFYTEDNMARPKAKATQALKLMEALAFIEPATAAADNPNHEFVNLSNKRAVAFNGVLSAGMEIEEELHLAPKLDTLKRALSKTGKSLTITELPSGRLSVKGEKITVQVPCVAPDTLPPIGPDAAIAPINDEIKSAFKALEGILSETGERVFETALMLESQFATATNGKILMQYWHGNDLPPGLLLPRAFIQAVGHQFKALQAFGWSQYEDGKARSVTFWFEDSSWIKTQVYVDKYPDVNPMLDVANSPADPPSGLWEGCATIAEFDENEFITFEDGFVKAGDAEYPVNGLQGNRQFGYKLLKKIIPFAKTIDLTTYPDRAHFFGEKVRGVIVGIKAVESE